MSQPVDNDIYMFVDGATYKEITGFSFASVMNHNVINEKTYTTYDKECLDIFSTLSGVFIGYKTNIPSEFRPLGYIAFRLTPFNRVDHDWKLPTIFACVALPKMAVYRRIGDEKYSYISFDADFQPSENQECCYIDNGTNLDNFIRDMINLFVKDYELKRVAINPEGYLSDQYWINLYGKLWLKEAAEEANFLCQGNHLAYKIIEIIQPEDKVAKVKHDEISDDDKNNECSVVNDTASDCVDTEQEQQIIGLYDMTPTPSS